MCWDGWDYYADGNKPDGTCPDCSGPTFDGVAMSGCNWSPVLCETCDDAPCDLSC